MFALFQRLLCGHSPQLPQGDDVLLIDVREPAEFAGGHAPGALSLPLGQLQSGIARIAPGLDTPMILYCASGMRSASGVRMLAALGYTGVHNAGGLGQAVAWARQRNSGT